MSLLFLLKYLLLFFFFLSLPIRSLEAEDFRLVVSWSGDRERRFPGEETGRRQSGGDQERNTIYLNIHATTFSTEVEEKWYLLMAKSRISAVWPWYSDTMLPERASHKRSAPSKLPVDTTEEDSSHCRWTMPAWRNKERNVNSTRPPRRQQKAPYSKQS